MYGLSDKDRKWRNWKKVTKTNRASNLYFADIKNHKGMFGIEEVRRKSRSTLSCESSLSEQLEAVLCLDEDILEILTDNVGEKDDGENILAKEITEAGSVRSEIKCHMKRTIILPKPFEQLLKISNNCYFTCRAFCRAI